MSKLIISIDALTLIQFLEENESIVFGKDVDWIEKNDDVEEAIFSSISPLIEYLKWKGDGYYVEVEEEWGDPETPIRFPSPSLAWITPGDTQPYLKLKILPEEKSGTVKIKNPLGILSDPDTLIGSSGREDWVTVRKLCWDIYKGKERLNYPLELAGTNWLVQQILSGARGDKEVVDPRQFKGNFLSDMSGQTLKYRVHRREDWEKFLQPSPGPYDKDPTPIRATVWKDPDGSFGIWIKPRQYFSDAIQQLPLGNPLLIKTLLSNPESVKEFIRFKLNEHSAVIMHFPDAKFCYIQSLYGTVSYNIGHGERIASKEERYCYNPKGFDLPVAKEKGNPPFHSWGEKDTNQQLNYILSNYRVTSEVRSQLPEEDKKTLRKLKELVRIIHY